MCIDYRMVHVLRTANNQTQQRQTDKTTNFIGHKLELDRISLQCQFCPPIDKSNRRGRCS
jgi:hypothetical protein